ncbi:hypothetical protein [Rhodoblastus sp.]|uniref:hypothetical protein n=1 Tax=Rhodoblastus sp. TaxID=1962975 RepID=UPI003F99E368
MPKIELDRQKQGQDAQEAMASPYRPPEGKNGLYGLPCGPLKRDAEAKARLIRFLDTVSRRKRRNGKGGDMLGSEKPWRKAMLAQSDELARWGDILRRAVQAHPNLAVMPRHGESAAQKAARLAARAYERALLGERAEMVAETRDLPPELRALWLTHPDFARIDTELAAVRSRAWPESFGLLVPLAQTIGRIVRAAGGPEGLADNGLVVLLVCELLDLAFDGSNAWPGANPEAIGRALREDRERIFRCAI